MGRLSGKVAVVTGGASGLGEAMVRLLAAHGAKVVVADLNAEAGEALAAAANRDGGEVVFMPLDVTDEQQWDEVMEKVLGRFGRLNVLVKNGDCSHRRYGRSGRHRLRRTFPGIGGVEVHAGVRTGHRWWLSDEVACGAMPAMLFR